MNNKDLKEIFYEELANKDWESCRKLIEIIKESGDTDLYLELLDALEEEIELDKAENKGSEDGVDELQG